MGTSEGFGDMRAKPGSYQTREIRREKLQRRNALLMKVGVGLLAIAALIIVAVVLN